MPAPDTSRWLTVEETAERLAVSTKTIRRWIASGDLDARRIGPRLIRVNPDALASAGKSLAYRASFAA